MRKKLRPILKISWPYALMVFLPILAVAILCTYIISNHLQQFVFEQEKAVQTAVDRVDQKLSSITEYSYLLSENNQLSRYVINSYKGEEGDQELSGTIKDLFGGIAQSDDIAEIYFYDANTGKVIATKTILNDAATFFRYYCRYLDSTPEEKVAQLDASGWGYYYNSVQRVVINGYVRDVIDYRISVPIQRFGKKAHQLTFLMDTDALFQPLFDCIDDGAVFRIIDSEGCLYVSGACSDEYTQIELTQSLQRHQTEAGSIYAMELPINQNWKIQLYYPELNTDLNSQNLMKLAPAVIIPVLLSICMCVYYTMKNHKEIMEIMSVLRMGEPAERNVEDSYGSHAVIQNRVREMATANNVYRAKLQKIQVSHKNNVLEHLIRNAYHSEKDKRAALKEIDLNVKDGKCVILCVQLPEIAEEHYRDDDLSIRDVTFELLKANSVENAEFFYNPPDEIICLLSAEHEFEKIIESIIAMLNIQIGGHFGANIKIGVGNPVDSIYEINRSYDQAKEVIRYGENAESDVFTYGKMRILEATVYYPVLTDEKITNYLVVGQAEKVKEIIFDIYAANFQNNKNLSVEEIALLKYRITNAVTAVAKKEGIPVFESTKKLLTEENVKKYFGKLADLVDTIDKEIMERKNNTQASLVVKVQTYISEHYMDTSLSIKNIASHFHFHENYISNLYKEEYGDNLSNAIELLRIDKACELLKSTDLKIGEVASAVGYASDSTFRRAFKKVTAISPADYRNIHENDA